MATKLIITVIVLGIVLSISDKVSACSCASISIEDEFSAADAVFTGKVLSIQAKVGRIGRWFRELSAVLSGSDLDDSTFDIVIILAVEKYWKGSASGTTTVETADPSICCTCGFEFRSGERYLVFASGAPLRTSSCSRTQLATIASPDIVKVESFSKEISKSGK
jgi:hypothetical protein